MPQLLLNKSSRVWMLTALAMLAFAGNSVLCRIALSQTPIDAASFSTIRLVAGALMLCLMANRKPYAVAQAGSWYSAVALCMYAFGFSFAYVTLPTATGALLLFGAVQITMVGAGIRAGERLGRAQWAGLLLSLGGLITLLLPGIESPPIAGAMLMVAAGIAWGVYSLRGKHEGKALHATAGNFLRAVPIALGVSLLAWADFSIDADGFGYAVASGALASGAGYAIWYAVLPMLRSTSASVIQLSVPVIAAVGGVLFLGEHLSLRLVLASVAVLGGIALVMARNHADT